MNPDLHMAIELHNKLNNVSPFSNKIGSGRSPVRIRKKQKRKAAAEEETTDSIVDPSWEISDPTPDIHSLFQLFDRKYFWGKLESIEVKWSSRMYSCAGICTYKGRLGGCVIALSLPLLKLRPRKDLVETLLHEMIHGYLFVADKNRDRGEHGPKFHEHMYRINREAGTKITVYHTFHEEVKHYKQHWWRCEGPCQSRPPYFGLVKRSMNRAPGPTDLWWAEHLKSCGGQFSKIREPPGFKARGKKKSTTSAAPGTALQNKPTSGGCKKKGGGLPQPTLDQFISGKVSSGAGGDRSRGLGVPGLRDLPAWTDSNPGTSSGASKAPRVVGFKDLPAWTGSNPGTSSGASKAPRVVGFKDLPAWTGSNPGTSSGASKAPRVVGYKDLQSVTGSNPGTSVVPRSSQQSSTGRIVPFSGQSYVLGGAAPRSSSSATTKPQVDKVAPAPAAVQISLLSDSEEEEEEILSRKVHCPSCSQEMFVEEVYSHLELCLESVFESFQEAAFPEELTDPEQPTLEQPTVQQPTVSPAPEEVPTVLCPVCGAKSSLQDINLHLDNCLV